MIINIFSILAVIGNLILISSLIWFFFNKKSRVVRRSFFTFVGLTTLWNISYSLFLYSNLDFNILTSFVRLSSALFIFVLISLAWVIRDIIGLKINQLQKILLTVIATALFLITLLSPFIVDHVKLGIWNNVVIFGNYSIIYILLTGLVLFVINYLIIKNLFFHKNLENKQKTQLKILFYLFMIPTVFGFTFDIINPFLELNPPAIFSGIALFIVAMVTTSIYKGNILHTNLTNLKIKDKISSSFIITYILIALTISLSIQFVNNRFNQQEILDHLETTAESRKKHIETYFSQNIERLKLVTSRTKLRQTLTEYNQDKDPEKIIVMENILKDAKEPIPDFKRICILDLNGQLITSTDTSNPNTKCENQNVFNEAKEKYNLHFIDDNGIINIYVAGPLILDNKTIGVAVTVVDITKLNEIVTQNTGLKNSGEILLAIKNKDGYPKFLTNQKFSIPEGVISTQNLTQRPMQIALSGKSQNFTNSLDYRQKRVIAVSKYLADTQVGLVTKIDISEINKRNYLFFLSFILLNIAGVIVYLFISKIIAKDITQNIEKLKNKIVLFEKGQDSSDIKIIAKDEVGDLGRSFDKMIKAVKESRKEIDVKVEKQVEQIQDQSSFLNDQRKAIINVLEDIDQDKKIAQRESDKTQKILESIGDGVFVLDEKKNIILFNNASQLISGYSEKEALGNNYSQILKFRDEETNEKINDFIEKVYSTGLVKSMDNHTILINKDNIKIPVADSAAPIKNAKGVVIGCVVVFRDVTKEREVDKMKTDFLSIAAHQLRTPLGSNRWSLELLLDDESNKLPSDVIENIKSVYERNKELINLVDDLLDVTRIDQARVKDNPKDTNINELIKFSIKELSGLAKERNVSITSKLSDKTIKVKLDPDRLKQIIGNLLSNAIKYNNKGGKIIITLKENKSNFEITVKDNGIGIPKEEQKNIFTKFYRAKNAWNSETEGSGLGLYVVKEYITNWGGKIGFTSQKDKGTQFHLTIPLKPKQTTLNTNLKSNPQKL